jgi:hypothetical protein
VGGRLDCAIDVRALTIEVRTDVQTACLTGSNGLRHTEERSAQSSNTARSEEVSYV